MDVEPTTLQAAPLVIAGVRFMWSGPCPVDRAALAPAFAPFLQPAASDLACTVTALGPAPSLDRQPPAPDSPWSFSVRGDRMELVRRDREGQILWHAAAPLTYEDAALSWSAGRFAAAYGSYEQAWSRGLGLTQLVFRLRNHGGLVLHGTAAEWDGRGVLCVGVSGSGKSTLARLLDGAGFSVLTDERPVIRLEPPSAAFRVHGSPWPSSAGFARRAAAPLRRIYFLEHGATDCLTPLTPREAFNRLIHVATIPWQDPRLFDPCLATVEALLQAVPAAVLAFRPMPAAAELLRQELESC